MSGRDGTEHPSDSPQRASFNSAEESNFNMQDVAVSLPSFAYQSSPFRMPSPERIQYSNKESIKVNTGLNGGGWTSDTPSAVSTNKPAVDFEFSQLIIPNVATASKPTTEALVQRLLHPPPHAFVHGSLSIQWVIGAAGRGQTVFRDSDERYVLAQDSELRKSGTTLGMPALYMEWLCGDDEEAGATEVGIYLTPDFFDEVNS